MKDGWWINTRSGKDFLIDEHERWIRRPGNAKKLGVPNNIQKDFSKFEPVKDRNEFLLHIMRRSPVMRVRGHGNYVTFEYASRSRRDAIDSIWMWGLNNSAGPFTAIYIVNLATGEKTNIMWRDFLQMMKEDRYDDVMRVAKKDAFTISKESEARLATILAGELVELANELVGNREKMASTGV